MSVIDKVIGSRPRPPGGIPRLKPGSVAFLSYGFRPFFLGAGLWGAGAMVLWIGLMSGRWSFAAGYGAVAWHAHEFLFGYVSAVLCGFLLTAIPNWTGRLPLQGGPLLLLFLIWVTGRIAMLLSDQIGAGAAAIIDGAFLFVLGLAVLREIVVGRNWRNLPIVLLICVLAGANVLFHVEVLSSGVPEPGIRIACAVIIGMIMLVGGRITPSFTRNWLARQGSPKLPTPMNRFDMASLGVAGLALLSWISMPEQRVTGMLLIAAAVAQTARLSRWAGERTWREPIVFILHVGYGFVPLGALILAVSILWPDVVPATGALHAWTTGAIGVMTLAVMTRATRGHTGRTIVSTPATAFIYCAIAVSAMARVAAPFLDSVYRDALVVAAIAWIAAFTGFVLVYGPMLWGKSCSDRPD
jgi:uncharacterized protein involved in response to NO